MGKTAFFWKKLATSAAVSGFVDGGLQLGRNVLEGKCDVWEGVGQQAVIGAAGGALGEGVEAGLKNAPVPKFLSDITDDDLSRLQQIRDALGKAGQDKYGEYGLTGKVRKGITKMPLKNSMKIK